MKYLFKLSKKTKETILALIGVIIFFSIWQTLSVTKLVDPIFISSPSEVLNEFFSMFQNRSIFPHLFMSLEEFAIGFVLATVFGMSLGMLIGWYKKLYITSNPLIYALYSTPIVALIPLIIIWTGLGVAAKVVIVFLAAFFPILINTISAIHNLNPEYVKLAKSFGAKDFDIFKTIALPASVPFTVTGLKIAVPRGIIGMVVGEFFVSNQGLGYLISFYGSTFQTAKLLAVVFLIILISVTFTGGVSLLEKNLKEK